jgi:hypothetical protein
MRRLLLSALPLLAACGAGEWQVSLWGEDFIEQGIPSEVFADGCSATFTEFLVTLDGAALLDGDGDVVGEIDGGSFDLAPPGPVSVGAVDVPAGTYTAARFVVASGGGEAVRAAGALSCGEDSVAFDWSFPAEATYDCAPDGLTIAAGGVGQTELTIHGDHLFYDGLEDPEAEVRGQALVDADADGDGTLTLAELEAVAVAPLGYSVGRYSEVTDLAAFVGQLTRTLGHVDGEGHCDVAAAR